MPLSDLIAQGRKYSHRLLRAESPKKAGSKAWERYEKYKSATTVGDATCLGAQWQDLSADFEKGFLKFNVEVNPRAATMSIRRNMMRKEIALGIEGIETRVANKLDDSLDRLHSQLAMEREACIQLEERVRQLKRKLPAVSPDGGGDEVDKPIAVIGGFGEKTVEETERLLQQQLVQIDGFQELTMTESEPPLGLARFQSPANAMTFIRSQKKHRGIQDAKLWAAENRTRSERSRLKIVSKLKKFLVELDGHNPADVIASYKLFNSSMCLLLQRQRIYSRLTEPDYMDFAITDLLARADSVSLVATLARTSSEPHDEGRRDSARKEHVSYPSWSGNVCARKVDPEPHPSSTVAGAFAAFHIASTPPTSSS